LNLLTLESRSRDLKTEPNPFEKSGESITFLSRQTLFKGLFSLCDTDQLIRISLKTKWRKRVRVERFRVLKTKGVADSKPTSSTQNVNF